MTFEEEEAINKAIKLISDKVGDPYGPCCCIFKGHGEGAERVYQCGLCQAVGLLESVT